MYRIGIIGSENSHALAFTKIINLSGKFEDMRVVGIAGESSKASEKVYQEGHLDFIAQNPQDFLGQVDAMMITSRHGGLHAAYARPFLEQGLPVFLDKPITDQQDTAKEILQYAIQCGAPVMGGSSTKLVGDVLSLQAVAKTASTTCELLGGHVWAPVNMVNDYGGFCFYASHLVEIALTIFGYSPVAVQAIRTSTGVSAWLEYDRYTVALAFLEELYKYGSTVLTKQGPVTGNLDISACYDFETAHFAEMVRTGKMPQPISEMLKPVLVINAIEKAFKTQKRIDLPAE